MIAVLAAFLPLTGAALRGQTFDGPPDPSTPAHPSPGVSLQDQPQDVAPEQPASHADFYVFSGDGDPFDHWTRNYQNSLTLSPYDINGLGSYAPWGDWYRIDVLARGYYVNDQRLEFTGQEATFGVEGVLAGILRRQAGDWEFAIEGELYLNQPFDRNQLKDTAERRSFLANFDIEPLEISQLVLSARNGDLLLAVGKMVTPFGRTYFPVYSNDRRDAPFIRTESILWRETGALVQYDPGILVLTGALVNGCEDMDTNSSKAFLARAGIDAEWFALGTSVKTQDGIGSEHQKTWNNHVGFDAMLRFGRCTLSAEAIYDEYGFRQVDFPTDEITWYHGLYHREQNRAFMKPITGFGYYVNFGYDGPCWSWSLNYGEFDPMTLGDPVHDVTTRRGIVKLIHHFTPAVDAYGAVIIENDVPDAQDGRHRQGAYLLAGLQAAF